MIEQTACALLDMSLHQLEDYDDFDIAEFESKELERLGMPQGIVMRHRPAHFQHLFSSSHYAAGYYVYLWAKVLDADVFEAFVKSGDVCLMLKLQKRHASTFIPRATLSHQMNSFASCVEDILTSISC